MRCEQARQFFDAYLDGELPAALATELGAHRVRCPECRRALALLEVSGHIIASDGDPVTLREDFAERLLGCMEPPKNRWAHHVRRVVYIAGSLAAAAVIVLAFVGVFDRHHTEVAGEKRQAPAWSQAAKSDPTGVADRPVEPAANATPVGDPAMGDEWAERTQKNLNAKLESGEKLREYFDLTILQWLEILDPAGQGSSGDDHFPGADPPPEPVADEVVPPATEAVEDL